MYIAPCPTGPCCLPPPPMTSLFTPCTKLVTLERKKSAIAAGSPWTGSLCGCVPGQGAARGGAACPSGQPPVGSSLPVQAAPASLLPGRCFQRCLTHASGRAGAEGQQGLAVDTGGVLVTLAPQPLVERGCVLAGTGSVQGFDSAACGTGRGTSRERGGCPAEHRPEMAGLAVAARWGAGGVSTAGSRWVRGVAGGLVRLKCLTKSCGNAASTVEHPGETTEGDAMGGAAPRCSSCLCERSQTRSAAAAMAMPRRQCRCQGEPAAVELPDRQRGGGPAKGKGDSVSPSCPIPKVPIAQEGGMGFRSPSCSRGRCVTGTGGSIK